MRVLIITEKFQIIADIFYFCSCTTKKKWIIKSILGLKRKFLKYLDWASFAKISKTAIFLEYIYDHLKTTFFLFKI